MECRLYCGACCIAPSISSKIPGMENGKKAGEPCIQLDDNNLCKIFNDPKRPYVCGSLKPCKDMCGNTKEEALEFLTLLEIETRPSN